jgi:hypothetical protein
MTLQVTREQRQRLRTHADCRFVDAVEFCRLLVSNRPLERSDDARARLRGLRDRSTGRRFLIEEESLTAHV